MSVHPFSTRDKLVIAIGLILLLGFLVVNLANSHVSERSVREALINSELPLTSNNIYSEIQASLLRPIYLSSLMANDTFLKDWVLDGEQDLDKVKKYLREIKDRYGMFAAFVVSDITKRYYHPDGILKTVSPAVAKDAWFFSMAMHPEKYRVDVDTNEVARNRLTIFINHKLYDYDGRFIGVTGMGLDVSTVSELIRKYKEQYHRDIFFIDRNGLIKSHEDDGAVDNLNIRNMPGIAAVADTLLGGREGFLEYGLGDDNVLLTYRFIPELDWYLVVAQPESEALQPIRQAFYFNMGLSAVVTLAVLLISGYTANRFQQKLESMARTDKLTGLYNRQYFDIICDNALKGVGRRKKPLSLIIFDIDSFKQINDRHGHLEGDKVIRKVADIVREVVRKSDVVSRWGGDEFIILLFDCEETDACRIAEKLRQRVKANVTLPGTGRPVTLSLGVAQYRSGDSYETLLDQADAGLYRAKRLGRDRTEVAGRSAPAPESEENRGG